MFPGPAAALAVQHNELMKYNHKSFCFLYEGEERNAEYSKQENPQKTARCDHTSSANTTKTKRGRPEPKNQSFQHDFFKLIYTTASFTYI